MTKNHQDNRKNKKGGKNSVEDLLPLTLIRLKIGTHELYLAFKFEISQYLVPRILSTWLAFLSREFDSLIYWSLPEDAQRYYPKRLKSKEYIIDIIDCTEGLLGNT